MNEHYRVFGGLAFASFLAAGWLTTQSTPSTALANTQPSSANEGSQTSAETSPLKFSKETNPEHKMNAPLKFSIKAVSEDMAQGETEILVDIEVPAPLGYPVTLRVTPPRDGSLVAGTDGEALDLREAGHTLRSFRVRTLSPLSADNPIKVTLDGQSPSGGMGLHGEKVYPLAVSAPKVMPYQGPRPPQGRPSKFVPPKSDPVK